VDLGYRTRAATWEGRAKERGVEDLDAQIAVFVVCSMSASSLERALMLSSEWL
jgi:hypothetical protein